MTGERIFRGRGVSVTLSEEPGLQLSLMYGSCWVKPMNREKLVKILRKDRGAASDREAGLPGGRGNGAGPDSGRSRGKPDSDGTG